MDIVCATEGCGINWGQFSYRDGKWFCERCLNPTPAYYRDDMEKIIGHTFGGTKTGHVALERHRKNRAETERRIGWDGSTTRDQRMKHAR